MKSSSAGFKNTPIVLKDDAPEYFKNTDLGAGESLNSTMYSGEFQKAAKIVIKDEFE